MTHTITIASNPRIVLVFLIAVVIPVGGVLLTILFHIFLGIIVTVVGGFIAWHLMKFGISSLKSWVRTDDEGITIKISNEDPKGLTWEEITHAGLVSQVKTRNQMFIYAEETDKLFTIPDEYSDFDKLIEFTSERTPFENVSLEQTDTITSYLREVVGVPEAQEEAEGSTDPPPAE
jgi:hypothetical protein